MSSSGMELTAKKRSGNEDVEDVPRRKRRVCLTDFIDCSGDESDNDDIDFKDEDVIDDDVREAKSFFRHLHRYKAYQRYLEGLAPQKSPDVCTDGSSSIVKRLAERELQADDAEEQSKIIIGSPVVCRFTGNVVAGPPTITLAKMPDRPASIAAMSPEDFFEKRGLNAAQSAGVAARAKVDLDFADCRKKEAADAKLAAHRRYVDGDVSLQSILRWRKQHRLDVREIAFAEKQGADIGAVARAQEDDAAELVRLLRSRLKLVMAPTRRYHVYSEAEHTVLRRAIGCSECQYKELQRCVYKEYHRIARITRDEFRKFPTGTFPVAFKDTRPLYEKSSECPVSFFRNMTKREPTFENVKTLLERFLSLSYTTDIPEGCLGVDEYDTDVDIGRIDGSVENLFDRCHGTEYTSASQSYIYVPINDNLVEAVRTLTFAYDGSFDFYSRFEGVTPYAVESVPSEKYGDFVLLLVRYKTLLHVLFGHRPPDDRNWKVPTFHHYKYVAELSFCFQNANFWETRLSKELQREVIWEIFMDSRLHFSKKWDVPHFSHGLKRLLLWFHDYEDNYDHKEHEANQRDGIAEPLLQMYDTAIFPVDKFEIFRKPS